jgi:hypothetical protein
VFESNLEDLENFAELLSPTSAQSRETRIVDSAQRIGFDESRELVISITGVHTEITMSDTQNVDNQLKNFCVDSSPISEFDYAKNEVIIPKNKRGIEGSNEYSYAYALATAALSPKLGAAKHFVT